MLLYFLISIDLKKRVMQTETFWGIQKAQVIAWQSFLLIMKKASKCLVEGIILAEKLQVSLHGLLAKIKV